MFEISEEVIDSWFNLGCEEGRKKEKRKTCFSCTEAKIAYLQGYDANYGTVTPPEQPNEPL